MLKQSAIDLIIEHEEALGSAELEWANVTQLAERLMHATDPATAASGATGGLGPATTDVREGGQKRT